MKLTLGFSPCPNDTFIFDALVNGRIDTEGLEFDYFLADVEELNRRAFDSRVDITKISCHAYAYASGNYIILDSGSALGYGSGPLLISREQLRNEDVNKAVIAIPGKYTTANLLFSIAWPDARNKREYLFSEIVNTLLEGKADAGLIIHETRFTYAEKGLVKIADMGEFWEKLTGLPVPLGFIVINRRIPRDIALKFNRILRKSIEFARENSSEQQDFVTSHAREIEKSVISRHIDLYVNDFTLTLGPVGRKAVSELYRIAAEKGVIPELPESIFLE
ncbi:MAG TPA: 1,4-dihydroxy-6-naphthoate synthase [Bacteroidales bacterium]|nr:1,4-dihydroxy-6-naphthoate synthase [Bacteroidales bacterium]